MKHMLTCRNANITMYGVVSDEEVKEKPQSGPITCTKRNTIQKNIKRTSLRWLIRKLADLFCTTLKGTTLQSMPQISNSLLSPSN